MRIQQVKSGSHLLLAQCKEISSGVPSVGIGVLMDITLTSKESEIHQQDNLERNPGNFRHGSGVRGI